MLEHHSASIQMDIPGVDLLDVAAHVSPGLSREGWLNAVREVGRIAGSSQWWIGDVLADGEGRFGKGYAKEAARVLSKSAKTIREYAYVSRNVPEDVRRTDLYHGHHRLVASFSDPEAQRRWLAYAADRELTVDELRRALGRGKKPTPPVYGAGTAEGLPDIHEWSTPQELFDLLDAEFGFELDVCASQSNAKCKRYLDESDDALSHEWRDVCWMNPPYGYEIGLWLKKAAEASRKGATVVALVPASTDADWWWDWCVGREIRFLRGRLTVGNAPAPFGSAVVVFQPFGREEVVWWTPWPLAPAEAKEAA